MAKPSRVKLAELSGRPGPSRNGPPSQRRLRARQNLTRFTCRRADTGLHADIQTLHVLNRYRHGQHCRGNRAQPDVVKTVDRYRPRPEGGEAGGQIVAQGLQLEIAACPEPHQRYLTRKLQSAPQQKVPLRR